MVLLILYEPEEVRVTTGDELARVAVAGSNSPIRLARIPFFRLSRCSNKHDQSLVPTSHRSIENPSSPAPGEVEQRERGRCTQVQWGVDSQEHSVFRARGWSDPFMSRQHDLITAISILANASTNGNGSPSWVSVFRSH